MGKILIVDDEKSIRLTLSEFLIKEGFDVITASNAFEALELLSGDEPVDVIVTDIIMPKISGIELIERVRSHSRTVQIILMTGEPTVDTAIKAVDNEVNAYLTKPVNRVDFLNAVRLASQTKQLIDKETELAHQTKTYQKLLESMVEQRTQELTRAMQSIILLISTVVEIRDPYTAGHQRRVGNLSAAIAQKLGLDKKSIDYIRIIGYIHDIGKISIPTEILSKPGKLSDLEMQLIKNHPSGGYELLSKADLPHIIAETIYQHHERCNGSGYPRKLAQKQILQEAKILMVADVVEAMISHRPYRPALGINAALDEICRNSGVLYDSEIVHACVSLFDKDAYEIDDNQYITGFPL